MSPKTPVKPISKGDYEALADFRYQLRRFLRFSEQVCQAHGITHLQYQLLLQIKGSPAQEWATIAQLAERLQAHHTAWSRSLRGAKRRACWYGGPGETTSAASNCA